MAKALTLSGSIRAGSYNRLLQKAVGKRLAEAGFSVTEGHLGDYDLPIFNEDLEPDNVPQGARDLSELMHAHDLIFIAAPEYNGGQAPLLVNALTWVSRISPTPFRGRLWAIGGVSSGKYGTIWSLGHLRDNLTKVNAVVLPGLLGIGPAKEAFNDAGDLVDKTAIRKLEQMIDLAQSIRFSPDGAPG